MSTNKLFSTLWMDTKYKLNTTGWEEVAIRFYSDDGIDVNIVGEKGVDKL